MKTIEELEAELETVTRERDLSLFAWESAGMQGRTAQSAMLELARQLEEACEMVELQNARLDQHHGAEIRMERERDEARDTIVALTTAMAEKDLEIATLTAALDERDLEAERGLEQYDKLASEVKTWQSAYDRANDHAWEQHSKIDRLHEQVRTLNSNIETFQKETWRYKRERDEARAEVERLTREPAVHPSNLTDVVSLLEDERDELLVRVANQDAELRATREAYNGARAEVERLTRESATLNAMLDGRMPDTWREDIETLTHQLADATNESTHFQVMCKRETEEVERLARQVEALTDERDELLVRVANQEAELRATREAYNGARAEVERLTAEVEMLRGVGCCESDKLDEPPSGPCGVCRKCAYRRGAEAMREACARGLDRLLTEKKATAIWVSPDEIRALPIPEEP